VLLDSRFSTAICAPVYSKSYGLSTQVSVDTEEGLKHDSSIHCDELVSIPKSMLTDFVGSLGSTKVELLNKALSNALQLDDD
jgi:mRNA interferase MazF